jgi:hypothetical protein
MLSIADIILLISKQYSIYVNCIILISAIIDNILNLAVFTQLTTYLVHLK